MLWRKQGWVSVFDAVSFYALELVVCLNSSSTFDSAMVSVPRDGWLTFLHDEGEGRGVK